MYIRTQEQFDCIHQTIEAEIHSGQRNILVVFSPGLYVAKEKHISVTNVEAPKTVLRFKGNGAVLVPYGKVYQSGDLYNGSFSPYSSWMSGCNDINVWSDVKYAASQVEIIDEANKSCRLKVKEDYSERIDVSNAFILIPHGYQSSVYKIDKFEKGYFYFTATDLKASAKTGYNVNDDYNYHKRTIRYKLSGVGNDVISVSNGRITLPGNIVSVREGKIQHFFYFENCIFKSLTIDGFAIYGNQSNPYVSSVAALYLNEVKSNRVLVRNCAFTGMKVNVISTLSTPNVHIEDNSFSHCYYNGVVSDNNSGNTFVKGNTFINMGKRMQNSFCVICRGSDYTIADNSFTDYGYSAIGVGVWYKSVQANPCNGVIENNTLLYTSEYMASIDNYGIMDGGAIYLWTKNDGAIIRNNAIQNYSGAGDNRGIFCDDGAYNFEIYENLITGISNSYCIDSRRVSAVEANKTPESGIWRSNVNNIIARNYVDGSIRLLGHETSDNGCIMGTNYLLLEDGRITPDVNCENISDINEPVLIECEENDGRTIKLKPSGRKTLRKPSSWGTFKRIIRRER